MGIYKRKQDSKKTRKHNAFDQESDQEKKKKRKKTRSRSTKRPRKKEKLFFDHFLGRVLVFLLSYFLVFFYKFPPLIIHIPTPYYLYLWQEQSSYRLKTIQYNFDSA